MQTLSTFSLSSSLLVLLSLLSSMPSSPRANIVNITFIILAVIFIITIVIVVVFNAIISWCKHCQRYVHHLHSHYRHHIFLISVDITDLLLSGTHIVSSTSHSSVVQKIPSQTVFHRGLYCEAKTGLQLDLTWSITDSSTEPLPQSSNYQTLDPCQINTQGMLSQRNGAVFIVKVCSPHRCLGPSFSKQ